MRNVRLKRIYAWMLSGVCCLPMASYADDVLHVERTLLSGFESIQSLEMEQALAKFSTLAEQHPNYKLAQLAKADLLALKAGIKPVSDQIHEKNPRTVGRLQDEAAVRWQFSNNDTQLTPDDEFSRFVLKSATQEQILMVSLADSRLYLYKRNTNGQMERVVDYYVTMGRRGSGKQREGDSRTPIGVYHAIDLLPGKSLPDLYGTGALPLNYPNQWDLKHGKTGSGIWLHGTPSDTYARAPKESRGCVVLNNTAMETLLAEYKVPYSTPVLIIEDPEEFASSMLQTDTVLAEVRKWLQDNHVGVKWDQVSVYRYPNEQDLLYVTFPKAGVEEGDENPLMHQYWRRGDSGSWSMVLESSDGGGDKGRV